jgi:outer membrane biosynthesis protein TonB
MKQTFAVMLVVLFTAFLSVSASAAYPSTKCIRDILKESVKYPDRFINEASTGEVVVVFTITDDGRIDIKSVKSTSEELEKYVREQLASTCCKNVISPYNQHYRITFKFRLT